MCLLEKGNQNPPLSSVKKLSNIIKMTKKDIFQIGGQLLLFLIKNNYVLYVWYETWLKFYSLPRYYTLYISPTLIHRFQYVQVLSTNRKVNVWLSRYVDIHCTVYDLSLNDHHWVSHRRVLEYECEYKKVQCYRYNKSIFELLFSDILLTI